MKSPHSVPPLPQPQQPAQTARALAEAARAAADAWTQPQHPDRHGRAVSQLSSTLRDIGIAARGLATWHADGGLPGPAPREFTRHATAAADWLLIAWNGLDGGLSVERIGPLPDPDEPGTALCRAARSTVRACRHPTGTAADRDTAVRELISATGFLSAGALSLAASGPPGRAAGLQAACASLSEAAIELAVAVEDAGPEPRRQGFRA
jgi:hypothetical protein